MKLVKKEYCYTLYFGDSYLVFHKYNRSITLVRWKDNKFRSHHHINFYNFPKKIYRTLNYLRYSIFQLGIKYIKYLGARMRSGA